MKAKKSFGQHFLKNKAIAEGIANAIPDLDQVSNILEIGPGKGMLTQYLLNLKKNLKVVELDRDMIPILEERFKETSIIQEDFLKLDLPNVFEGEDFCLVGNYPYNISSQIVFKMLAHHHMIPSMVGMFQKEVAERIISPAGTKKFGIISVFTQLYYEGELVYNISREEFDPPPNVESAVIKLTRKEKFFEVHNPILFKKIVKESFGMRRKMIRKTIKAIIPGHDFLNDKKLDLRPEKYSTEEFVKLSNEVNQILQERKKEKNV